MKIWFTGILWLLWAPLALAWGDMDEDGVPDLKDACGDTPLGLAVYANGCSKMPLSQLCLPASGGGVFPDNCAAPTSVVVHFPTGSAALPQSQWSVLADIARFLKTYPSARMALAGHADDRGSDAINVPLSLARADAVKRVLVDDYGIAAERLMVSGEGSSMPVSSEQGEKGKYLNRRVEFVIKNE
ncbi:OmpA family protein [Shewanella sp. GXUN23E]|uniref:OmpA family protein n=1 Tax=Shewanella sp. GXUN23E TaxID=3422498 RepID=UPI003D7C9646